MTHPACGGRIRILRAAWTSHPDSFALALAISSRHGRFSEELKIEAIGWGRTAVALRPNNALAHYYFALALGDFGFGDRTHAVAELQRATQLAPRFAKAYGHLALTLGRLNSPEAVSAAHKAIELDPQNICGHVVLLRDFLGKKDYIEAAKVYRRMAELKPHLAPYDDWTFEGAYAQGVMHGSIDDIQVGLIRIGRPFEAYHLKVAGYGGLLDLLYNSACAAALAGTGQGLDAPPPAERPAIRKHALEWLHAGLAIQEKEVAALPVFGASTAGLMASPSGQGSLLWASSALPPGSPHPAAYAARSQEAAHEGMNHWLRDPDLAGVRDDQWLAKLPADEREQWRKLWGEVRSLRDRAAPAKAVPPAAVGK